MTFFGHEHFCCTTYIRIKISEMWRVNFLPIKPSSNNDHFSYYIDIWQRHIKKSIGWCLTWNKQKYCINTQVFILTYKTVKWVGGRSRIDMRWPGASCKSFGSSTSACFDVPNTIMTCTVYMSVYVAVIISGQLCCERIFFTINSCFVTLYVVNHPNAMWCHYCLFLGSWLFWFRYKIPYGIRMLWIRLILDEGFLVLKSHTQGFFFYKFIYFKATLAYKHQYP